MFQKMRRSQGIFKNQVLYVSVGTAIGFVSGVTNYFPWYRIPIPPILNPFISLYVVMVAYAIIRYHLMDINVAITRTAVFAGVYALVLGLPLAGALAWQPQLERLLGVKWWVGLWVVGAGLATGAHYVNLYFQRRAEERLRREERQYQAALAQASHGMTQLRDLKKLLNMIVHVITRAVGLSHAAVFLEDSGENGGAFVLRACRYHRFLTSVERLPASDPLVSLLNDAQEPIVMEELQAQLVGVVPRSQKETNKALAFSRMQALNASVAVPSFMQERLIGFLVLGEKLNRQVFTSEDLSVFSTLANQAALAIENARFFEEIKTNEAYMIQSEKMASLGQLASGMAHEIHNPLAIISGEAQLYLEGSRGKSEEVDKLLASIIDECNRAADITRRILRFAKPGKQEFVPVDVRAVIEESLPLVAYRIRLDRVERQVVFPPEAPKVLGNQNQIQEVFLNLILNACQAMGEQGGKLTITGAVKGHELQVQVTDTGPGIPYAKLSKIFDPFYTTKHSGTGLGLFVSQRIVRAHNGSMTVQSVEGKGTTFTVRLPIWREGAAPLVSPGGNGVRL